MNFTRQTRRNKIDPNQKLNEAKTNNLNSIHIIFFFSLSQPQLFLLITERICNSIEPWSNCHKHCQPHIFFNIKWPRRKLNAMFTYIYFHHLTMVKWDKHFSLKTAIIFSVLRIGFNIHNVASVHPGTTEECLTPHLGVLRLRWMVRAQTCVLDQASLPIRKITCIVFFECSILISFSVISFLRHERNLKLK